MVFLENPNDIRIAMSFCLFSTSKDSDEIILNEAIAIIRVSMINITLSHYQSLEIMHYVSQSSYLTLSRID